MPDWKPEILKRLERSNLAPAREAEIAEELAQHLEDRYRELASGGATEAEARFQSLAELSTENIMESEMRQVEHPAAQEPIVLGREARSSFVAGIWQDVRYGFRMLARNPGFTAIAVLTLALGIGANTAIYSFVDALLLRSLPVSDPASLVVVNWHAKGWRDDFVMHDMSGDVEEGDPKFGSVSGIFPYPAFELLQKSNEVFSDVFAYCQTGEVRAMSLTFKGQSETAHGELVSGDYFAALAVRPAAGRLIISDDDRAAAPAVVVVSHAFSEKQFGGPGKAPGQSILLNNLPFTVVGVAPPEFFGVDPAAAPDLYLPMHANLLLGAANPFGFRAIDYQGQNYYWVEMMARLRPGVSLERAQAALAPRFQQWVATTASNNHERINLPALILRPGAAGLNTLRREFSKPLYILTVLVGLILAIACFNVANLLLWRAASRRREIALRLSVGAGRLRVIRQLLTESVLLASLGGVAGVLFAIWGIRFLGLLLEGGPQHINLNAQLNWHVLCATFALSLFTGVLFGLAPAIQSTNLDLVSSLKESRGRRTGARRLFRRVGMGEALVVGQIAISLLMLVAAGLFVRTLSNLQSIQLGFNRDNVLLFQVNARQAGHRDPEIDEFYGDLREQLAAIPGVRQASLAEGSLIGGETQLDIRLPEKPRDEATRAMVVGPEFLTTMQVPLLAGRDIDERDLPGSQAVAVINERFARINFGNHNPLGRHLILSKDGRPARDMEVVGIFKDARYADLRRVVPPVVFIPYNQGYPQRSEMTYALRTAGNPLSYINSVREIVRQADSRMPVSDVRTQKIEIQNDIHQEITLADLCSVFAMLALTIACVGLYGTISYNVANRTNEIGIRMALGAGQGKILGMVMGETLVLAALGVAIGIAAALGGTRVISSMLYELKPNDPLTIIVSASIMLAVGAIAGYIPARRATKIDPMVALRWD